jgi:hypothetical protein
MEGLIFGMAYVLVNIVGLYTGGLYREEEGYILRFTVYYYIPTFRIS